MEYLLLILFLPVAWPFIAQRIWHSQITYIEMGIQITIVVVVTGIVYSVGMWNVTQDIEVWNGVVIKKDRQHDTYEESYSCNCITRTDSNGNSNTSCSTCFRTHYTVEWTAKTTVGDIVFDSRDSTTQTIYMSTDPRVYKQCFKGQPASIEHSYVNYVQATPDSLFASSKMLANQYADQIPSKPRVYDHYQYDRVINNGVLDKEQEGMLERALETVLITMGKSHQVNIIVILTKITDPHFRYAVENAWEGGEKNDVVVFIGVNEDMTIAWADVMTWALNSGNEELQINLRNDLMSLDTINATTIGQSMIHMVSDYYTRPKMKDYEYLKDASTPSIGIIVFALMVAFGFSIGLTWFFYEYDVIIGKGRIDIRPKSQYNSHERRRR